MWERLANCKILFTGHQFVASYSRVLPQGCKTFLQPCPNPKPLLLYRNLAHQGFIPGFKQLVSPILTRDRSLEEDSSLHPAISAISGTCVWGIPALRSPGVTLHRIGAPRGEWGPRCQAFSCQVRPLRMTLRTSHPMHNVSTRQIR